MRRNIGLVGRALVFITLLGLCALDIYTDRHPEVLMKFKTEHPQLFPTNPWQIYVIAVLMVIAIALLGWWMIRGFTTHNRRSDKY